MLITRIFLFGSIYPTASFIFLEIVYMFTDPTIGLVRHPFPVFKEDFTENVLAAEIMYREELR
jgi:hypothetical protein